MEFSVLIVSFIGLMFIICGIIIFVLRRTFVSSTDSAIKRLNDEIAEANKKQIELTNKIKAADDELAKREAEARELSNKMKSVAEEESKKEREKIITKAREEGEEIISKANMAKEKIRQELEKEAEIKIVNRCIEILNQILNEKAKGSFSEVLVNDFLENLKETDMSRIGPDINTVDVITPQPIDDNTRQQFLQIIKGKLNREVTINATTDPNLGGGVVVKFGSMALDGSLKSTLQELGRSLVQDAEEKLG